MAATRSFLEPPKMLAGENIVKSLIPSKGIDCHLHRRRNKALAKYRFMGTNPWQTKEMEACKDLHPNPRRRHSHEYGRIEDQDGRQGWLEKICQA